MNKQIEDIISKCSICQTYRSQQQREPMLSTIVPNLPWEIASSDLFEFEGESYIIVTDHYSGYLDIHKLSPDQTTSTVIDRLKQVFSTHGIPQILYHDIGTQYTSGEFKEFSREWGFQSIPFSATYSQANGFAEKSVQIAKNMVKKSKLDGKDLHLALLDFRNTPRDHILGSPGQRCMGRRTRTRMPTSNALLKPNNMNSELVSNRLTECKQKSKSYYDIHAKPLSELTAGDTVRYRTGKTWTPAKLVSRNQNPRSYDIRTPAGKIIVRNRRHLLKTHENDIYRPAQQHHNVRHSDSDNVDADVVVPMTYEEPVDINVPVNTQQEPLSVPPNLPTTVTRSGRVSKPPERFKDFVMK